MFEGILAGIDGSHCALDAALWAAAEARTRRLRLQLLHVVPPVPDAERAKAEDRGRDALIDAAQAIEEAFPDSPPRTLLLHGDPGHVLLRETEQVGFGVLGRHGDRLGARARTGSTAYEVAGRIRCPVVVVPEGTAHMRGPVVVGVDGSREAAVALRFAFDAARERHVPLRLIHVVRARAGSVPDTDLRVPDHVRRLSSAVLTSRALADPRVDVAEEALWGSPAQELAALGAHAGLLVVGSHGIGGVHLTLARRFGSVSEQLVHTAPCPLAVVRR
ncbi:universal stress protein [Actinomadura gamaensis]|uniref:Universal stress protein n=1 Tax=Actinomadura gamaensis TaxID=1763541 RepID=A0ABV9TUU1_9ACTN